MLVYIWLGLLTICAILLFRDNSLLFDSALSYGKVIEKLLKRVSTLEKEIKHLKNKKN